MKILILFDSYSLGGAERHGLRLAEYILHNKIGEVAVAALEEGDGTIKAFCARKSIPTFRLEPFNRIQRFLFIPQALRYCNLIKVHFPKPDVIISFNYKPNFLNALIWRFTGAKLAIWSQQGISPYPAMTYIEKNWLRSMPCFISNSEHGKRFLTDHLNIEKSKIQVVSNGIETPAPVKDRQEWREGLDIKEDCFTANMVANLTQTKDHITLLKAWQLVVENLKKQDKDCMLLLAGRAGNTTEQIISVINQLGLHTHVRLLGNVDDIWGLNYASDLSILSSPAEGMPNGIMEAMACGLPVVATAIDGVKEAVGSENYTYLFETGNHTQLAEKILLFANDKTVSKKTGEANRQRIAELFSIERMCTKTLDIIKSRLQ